MPNIQEFDNLKDAKELKRVLKDPVEDVGWLALSTTAK
jgi:hypothetical protein